MLFHYKIAPYYHKRYASAPAQRHDADVIAMIYAIESYGATHAGDALILP